ncbi:MAG: DUF6503 family protein [Gemmatimonadota bacterium]|nr:DUF6503 family protein [Gemmatimonadota bacterium]MDE2866877.1 DUF6503 family protein [Gemmatimonadota bacterium]
MMPRSLPAPAFSGCRRLTVAAIPVAFGLLACAGEQAPSGPPTTGPELLEAAIRYHDPDDRWPRLRHTLVIDQSRPDGSERRAAIFVDAASSDYRYEEDTADGHLVKGTDGDECFSSVDGAAPTEDQAARLRLDCANVRRMRNYYLYLWGLPMKLRDPGTNIDPAIGDAEFDGMSTKTLRVTYDPGVGSDTWYFHFDPGTYRMVGYRFYHDEAAGDGEYILLDGEREVTGMRIPVERRWFTNAGDRYLGTDVLVDDYPGAQPGA